MTALVTLATRTCARHVDAYLEVGDDVGYAWHDLGITKVKAVSLDSVQQHRQLVLVFGVVHLSTTRT